MDNPLEVSQGELRGLASADAHPLHDPRSVLHEEVRPTCSGVVLVDAGGKLALDFSLKPPRHVVTCIRTGTGACGKLGTTWLPKNALEAGAG